MAHGEVPPAHAGMCDATKRDCSMTTMTMTHRGVTGKIRHAHAVGSFPSQGLYGVLQLVQGLHIYSNFKPPFVTGQNEICCKTTGTRTSFSLLALSSLLQVFCCWRISSTDEAASGTGSDLALIQQSAQTSTTTRLQVLASGHQLCRNSLVQHRQTGSGSASTLLSCCKGRARWLRHTQIT